MNKTNISAIVWCCLILQQCIRVEYIEDRKRILSNIKAVNESKDLYKLEIDDTASIRYDNKKYTYKIVNIYTLG